MKRSLHFRWPSAIAGQRGFSMVEVLVAAVVLSIGMLGLAGLQMRTLRNNQSALERAVAVVEIHAMADALRADRVNASNSLFDIALADADPTGATFAAVVVAGWRANLRTELGANATGAVDCNGFVCVITVRWNELIAATGTSTTAPTTLTVQTTVQI
jgi:type IV pilus assembly protein PilV